MILTAIDLLLCQKSFDRNVRVGHRKGHFQDVTGGLIFHVLKLVPESLCYRCSIYAGLRKLGLHGH